MSDRVSVHIENGIADVRLNRPEKMNSITSHILVDLTNSFTDVTLDDEVRALMVTGNGRALCGGTDLSHGLARDQVAAGEEREKRLKNWKCP